jgi:AraC-like DNA-binding protein
VRAATSAGAGVIGESVAIANLVSSDLAREAMAARLAEMMLLMGLRRAVGQAPAPHLWASGAFLHPQLGRAMRALHGQPTRRWTAASLAREAAMSRSTFAELFTRLVGEPPLAYLTRLRMRRAVEILRDGGSLSEVSWLVGYGSEGAFSKAFKRSLGVSPGAYRAATAAAR